MGFQQQVLDNMFVAFLSSFGSLVVVIPSNYAGIHFPLIGCMLNIFGACAIFYFIYKYFYQKKFHTIHAPQIFGWWIYLSISFALAFSAPIILRESWIAHEYSFIFTLIPLVSFVLFEIYSFRLGIKNWIKG